MSEDVEIRAARAEQLLQDEVLAEARDAVFLDTIEHALRVDIADPAQCIRAVACIQAAQAMKDKLASFVTAGKAAERKPYKVA